MSQNGSNSDPAYTEEKSLDEGSVKPNALPRYFALYVALYLAYGTESAYLPAFLRSHGLAIEEVGLTLAAGTVVRIVAGPITGRLADYLKARKEVLSTAAASSGLIGFAYIGAFGFVPLLCVSACHAAATASLAPLSDTLSVSAATQGKTFRYGWVRGAGSAAFVCGTLLSGQLIDSFGLGFIIVSSSAFFLVMAVGAMRVSDAVELPDWPKEHTGHLAELWRIGIYWRLLVVAFLVVGSHALNDAFAVIQWRAAGYGSVAVSLLWSEAVLAEVLVFFHF